MPAETPEQETQEAQQYWGYLVKQDKCGTDLLNRLLRGIANHISATVQPDENCPDLTPSQLAEFYKSVGGDYDVLFIDTVPNSISFIYKSLGCVHSLHPPKGVDKYEDPSIPALKPQGFVTWQTIQLLLGPEEHVPFLQNAVKKFDITDPANGKVFPKLLPPECLPTTPDEDMLTWYDSVSQRLQADAEAVDAEQSDRAQLGAPHYGHGLSPGPGPVGHLSRTESYASTDDDSRYAAAKYFSNPLYRSHGGRPTIIRRYSRDPPRSPPAHHAPHSPRARIVEGGKTVARTFQATFSPHLWTPRQRSHEHEHNHTHHHPRRSSSGDREDTEEISPQGGVPPARHNPRKPNENRQFPLQPLRPSYQRRPSQHTPPHSSEEPSDSSDTSDGDSEPPDPRDLPPNQRHHRRSDPNRPSPNTGKPPLRQRRSHDPPSSPREYFSHLGSHRRSSSGAPAGANVSPADGRRHSHTPSSPSYFPPINLPPSSNNSNHPHPSGPTSAPTPNPSLRVNSSPASSTLSPTGVPLPPPPHTATGAPPPDRMMPPPSGLGVYREPSPATAAARNTHNHNHLASHEFGPSASPLFATHVAHLQAPAGYERSGSLPANFAPGRSSRAGGGGGGGAGAGGQGQNAGGMGPPPIPVPSMARGPMGGAYAGRPGSVVGSVVGSAGGGGSGGRGSIDSGMREGTGSPVGVGLGVRGGGGGGGGWYDPRSGTSPRDRDGWEGGRDPRDRERESPRERESREFRREQTGREGSTMHRYVSPTVPVNGVGGRRYPQQGDRY